MPVLGQVATPNTSDTTVYTVPADTEASIAHLNLCNPTAADMTITVDVRPDGAAAGSATKQLGPATLGPGNAMRWLDGAHLGDGDIVSVKSNPLGLAATLYGRARAEGA